MMNYVKKKKCSFDRLADETNQPKWTLLFERRKTKRKRNSE